MLAHSRLLFLVAGTMAWSESKSRAGNLTLYSSVANSPVISDAGAISNCSAALLDFYNHSRKLSDLDSGDWAEIDIDRSLCKAGLWGCKRADTIHSTEQCPTKAPGEVRVAVIVLASDSSWKGAPEISILQELLKALDHPAFLIFIHVDQHSSPTFKDAVNALAEQQSRVQLVKISMGCSWGGASITGAQLSAMADMHFGYKDSCIDLVINLSNSDFPLKSAEAIQKALASSIDHVHFDFFPKQGSNDTFHQGPDPVADPKDPHMFYLPDCWVHPVKARLSDMHPDYMHRRHQALESWQFVVSSQFWVLSREAVKYLVTSQHVQFLWHYLKHTPVTDESFVSTAIYNDRRLRETIREGAFKYIGKIASGRVIGESDLSALNSCKFLFARKFVTGKDALVMTNTSRSLCS